MAILSIYYHHVSHDYDCIVISEYTILLWDCHFISNISVIAIVFTIIFLSSLSLYADNYYDIPIIIAFLILLLFYHYYANYIPMISSFVITMIFLLLP